MYQYQKEKNILTGYLTEEMQDSLNANMAIIAGGCIRSIFCNAEINDVDIYFRNKEDALSFISDIKGCTTLVNYTDKSALFLHGNGTEKIKLQVIFFDYFESCDDVFNAFDFYCCMGAYDFSTDSFHFHDRFFADNCSKIINVNANTRFPLISMLRVEKYKKYGYTISDFEIMKIALAISNTDIESWEDASTHMGGMYGVNIDKIFDTKKPFSKKEVLDQLSNDIPFFKEENPLDFSAKSFDELYFIIKKEKIYFYPITDGGDEGYCFYNSYVHQRTFNPSIFIKTDDISKVFPKLLYKVVNKINGTFSSRMRPSFKYVIGEKVVETSGVGLFFTNYENIKNEVRTYGSYKTTTEVILEVELTKENFKTVQGCHILLNSCTPIREISVEDYMKDIKHWSANDT